MENKAFSLKLEKRTKDFAVEIIKLSASLPMSQEFKVIKHQLTKSGTSIGANYREANRSRSKADFKNRIKICESEASETVYWLEIIESLTEKDKEELKRLKLESNELLAIYTSISYKLND
jgi:four helix bundle protein